VFVTGDVSMVHHAANALASRESTDLGCTASTSPR